MYPPHIQRQIQVERRYNRQLLAWCHYQQQRAAVNTLLALVKSHPDLMDPLMRAVNLSK